MANQLAGSGYPELFGDEKVVKKIVPGHYDKVGQGYAGLGKQELKKRMKQHKLGVIIALKKGIKCK